MTYWHICVETRLQYARKHLFYLPHRAEKGLIIGILVSSVTVNSDPGLLVYHHLFRFSHDGISRNNQLLCPL